MRDTKVALLSGAPSDIPLDWFLTNDMAMDARKKVNDKLGARRLLAHQIFTPGQPGWMEDVDRGIAQARCLQGLHDRRQHEQGDEPLQKQHGFKPLGAADGLVKTAIFGENVARLYGYKRSAELAKPDRLVAMKEEYERRGGQRSNLRYGYVVKA